MRLLQTMAVVSVSLGTTAHADTFAFNQDPFAGSNAGNPGRQIIGNELFIPDFDIATDVFMFDQAVFGFSGLSFATGLADSIPETGVNVIVLQNGAPLAAGTAANAIADRITQSGPGFFIYFNSGLDLPRLVYSNDLSDNTADLKILARLTNLGGQAGRDLLPTFSAANFQEVPEPSTVLTAVAGLLLLGAARRKRRHA